MENYVKGRNVEPQDGDGRPPFSGLPPNFTWMRVGAGTKMRNVVGYAIRVLEEVEEGDAAAAVVFSGHGQALNKVVSCAEIVKRKFPGVHQHNRLCVRTVEEHWDPKEGSEEGLDSLKVVREVPQMHIALSRSPCVTSEPAQDSLASFLDCGDEATAGPAYNRKRGPHRRGGGKKKAAEELGMLPRERTKGKGQSNRGKHGRKEADVAAVVNRGGESSEAKTPG